MQCTVKMLVALFILGLKMHLLGNKLEAVTCRRMVHLARAASVPQCESGASRLFTCASGDSASLNCFIPGLPVGFDSISHLNN